MFCLENMNEIKQDINNFIEGLKVKYNKPIPQFCHNLNAPSNKVYYGGYDTLEYTLGDTTFPNIGDPVINSEFPKISHSSIVEVAVQLIARSLEDVNAIQITEDKLNITI